MLQMLFAIAGTGVILLSSEYLCRKRILKGEFARKYVHILTASFVAFWPLFLSFYQITILSILFALGVVIVKKLKLFRSFKGVRRATYGEIWYALGIGICAILFQDEAIFAIAILTMALADGFAAVVGVGLSKRTQSFKINKVKKTIAGSITFFLIAAALNAIYWYALNPTGLGLENINPLVPLFLSIGSAGLLTFAEIVSPKGSDNVIVPVLAGALLWLPTLT